MTPHSNPLKLYSSRCYFWAPWFRPSVGVWLPHPTKRPKSLLPEVVSLACGLSELIRVYHCVVSWSCCQIPSFWSFQLHGFDFKKKFRRGWSYVYNDVMFIIKMTLYQLIVLQILSKKTPFIRSWKNSVGNKTLPVIPSDGAIFKEPSRMDSPDMFRTFRQISSCLNIMHLFHLQDPNMDETPNSILSVCYQSFPYFCSTKEMNNPVLPTIKNI